MRAAVEDSALGSLPSAVLSHELHFGAVSPRRRLILTAKSGADQVKEMVTGRERPGERGRDFGTDYNLVLWETGVTRSVGWEWRISSKSCHGAWTSD